MSNRNLQLLIATRNRGKILEIQDALASLPLRLRLLEEFDEVLPVEEVGKTYEANAVLKALGYSKQTGVFALADDSGLEVDALGGRPGVFSARFGGDGATDQQRLEKLLTELSFGKQKRSARFVCCMALAGWESDDRRSAEPHILNVTQEKCEGVITMSTRGESGFGYDPIFAPAGYDRTFGELPSRIKNAISHRALALAAMRDFLHSWLA
jgi:XTP/dITP diphosphohydrolase